MVRRAPGTRPRPGRWSSWRRRCPPGSVCRTGRAGAVRQGAAAGRGGPSHSVAGMDRPVSAVPDCLGRLLSQLSFLGWLVPRARPGDAGLAADW